MKSPADSPRFLFRFGLPFFLFFEDENIRLLDDDGIFHGRLEFFGFQEFGCIGGRVPLEHQAEVVRLPRDMPNEVGDFTPGSGSGDQSCQCEISDNAETLALGSLLLFKGKIYGTVIEGGNLVNSLQGQGLDYRWSKGAGFEVVHIFTAGEGWRPYAGVIDGGDNTLYGTTTTNSAGGGGSSVYAIKLKRESNHFDRAD